MKRSILAFPFAVAAAVLSVSTAAADATSTGCNSKEMRATVQRVIDADYRADLQALKRGGEELSKFEPDRNCGARASYWRGFAGWRYATNASNNEAATRSEIAEVLRTAAGVLRTSLAKHPDDVEAKIALMGIVQMVPIFLDRGSIEQRDRMKDAVDLNAELSLLAHNNPRFLWLRGGTHFWAPAPFGEGPDAALASYFRGIAFATAQTPTDVIDPSWGLPELVMSVAYVSAHREKPDLFVARQFLAAALRLRPDWSYVRHQLTADIAGRSVGAKQ